MSQATAAVETQPLSEVARVVDTFVAPSKTFADIRRNRSWWLPFILLCIVGWCSTYAVDRTIGFAAVAQQQVDKNPKQSEQMQELTPPERAQRMAIVTKVTKTISYAIPALALAVIAIEALVLWASFNFILGAQTAFAEMFALILYAGLPRLFIWILNIILLFAGVSTENYDPRNPVGTNIGYFLSDAPNWLKTFGSFFDIFSIWSLVLLIIGTAIIARKTKGQAAMVIIGWWIVIIIVSTGFTAITG